MNGLADPYFRSGRGGNYEDHVIGASIYNDMEFGNGKAQAVQKIILECTYVFQKDETRTCLLTVILRGRTWNRSRPT